MKNKLLVSSALVSGMILSGSAIAQTTITGSLNLDYRAVGKTTTVNSGHGFGREAQINVQNKGKLNNGFDYAAGFALEFDGTYGDVTTDGTNASSISNENTFIDFIYGNTTLSFGIDHMPNTANNIAPTASYNQADNVAGLSTTLTGKSGGAAKYTNTGGANPKEAIGVGIIQNIPGIATVSALFVPQNGDTGAHDTRFIVDKAGRESAYEVGISGGFGVTGLTARYFYNKEDNNSAGTVRDASGREGKIYGAVYNMGQFAIGADRFVTKATTNLETVSNNYGISYAVDKNLAVSVNRARSSTEGTVAGQDETVWQYGIGYNLGPVSVSADYTKVNNLSYSLTENAKMFGLHLATKF